MGSYERFAQRAEPPAVTFDTTRADVTLGGELVRQRDAVYRLSGSAPGGAGRLRINISVTPPPNSYFPPVELNEQPFISGYVVPGLSATASGEDLRRLGAVDPSGRSRIPRSQLGSLAGCHLGMGCRTGRQPQSPVRGSIRLVGALAVFPERVGLARSKAGASFQPDRLPG